ncbi:restriction endonuclease subunit S [Pseudoalteromonas gelatinilytica]|uniref:restriction endonuclease subunit S n=1 Tax=Pseudoalteromonas gelatinilytica TaxID=1703256 RepID=UPI0007C4D121|nr:restriction endonuclease subunit S [Pseudoalteromonas gelatinilytica]
MMKKFKDLVTANGVFSDGDWVESKDQNPNGDVRLIQLADIGVGTFIDKSNRFMTSEKAEELKCTYLEEGDILIARMPDPIGRACIFPELNTKCVTVVDICIVRPASDEIDSRWLMHLINSERFNNQILKFVTGTTRQRISRGNLAKLDVEVPPLEKQKRIAAILDKADNVRRKRQQAIDLADDFLRSVFLDMFGDPATNPKGFPLGILSDFYIDHKNGTKCGPFGSALKKHEYVENGVPVWNMDNISLNGKFTDSPRLWITESKYVDLEAYSVEDGDVIISRAGTVGKMGVVRSKSEHSIISTNLIRVRFGEKLRPEYFVNLMNYCKGRVGRLKTGPDGAFTHMNTGILDKLEFPYPPIELQNRFIEIKEKVISSLEKSERNEIDNLFNSLSQKAFAGEL